MPDETLAQLQEVGGGRGPAEGVLWPTHAHKLTAAPASLLHTPAPIPSPIDRRLR